MATLRHYTEANGGEYIVIVTEDGREEADEDFEGDTLELEVELPGRKGDYIELPTNRVLRWC